MKATMHNYSTWIDETEPNALKELFDNKLKLAGFGILKVVEHNFKPYGYTCLWLLSESHFALHTFPEEGKTYIELSSCVKKQFDLFIKRL
jgi:S-adenosylmethionine/arginine decarboxylase-like enzyme